MRARVLRGIGLAAALLLAPGPRLAGQAASLIGMVARDTNNTRLDGAEVAIVSLNRTVTSNYLGEFRINDLPPGRHAVTVRHVGFTPFTDTIEFKPGAVVTREFVLLPAVAKLDSVRVVAAHQRKYISPNLNAFEERRKMGFGHFLDDSLLRLHDSERLSSIVRRFPGVNLVPYRAGMYAGTMRIGGGTRTVLVEPSDSKSPKGCWSTVFLDGAMIYSMSTGRLGQAAPDYNGFNVSDLGAVEFYPGTATIPVQYAATEFGCGTLLLWTRER